MDVGKLAARIAADDRVFGRVEALYGAEKILKKVNAPEDVAHAVGTTLLIAFLEDAAHTVLRRSPTNVEKDAIMDAIQARFNREARVPLIEMIRLDSKRAPAKGVDN